MSDTHATEKQKIKETIEKEIRRNIKEIELHKFNYDCNKCKKQKEKMQKHIYYNIALIKIAKELGFRVCNECGGLK